jgi:hypothetical protein
MGHSRTPTLNIAGDGFLADSMLHHLPIPG